MLNDAGEWVYEEVDLRNIVVQFFNQLYLSSNPSILNMYSVSGFPAINPHDWLVLNKSVSMEEVKQALFSMGSYKSPGPDGFHPIFFKSQWDVVGPSVFDFVRQVCTNLVHIRQVNHTLLTLIPKCDNPSHIRQFRPIALCNVIYKIVTKVVAQRLKIIMPKVISEAQSSFVPGRHTTDNAIILQEMVHSMRLLKGKTGYMIIKLDLEKAYDRVEWSFLQNTLEMLGIPCWMTSLILSCISSSSMSINWNGNCTDAFYPSRGLRQGDLLSPYLFVLCLERLAHCINDSVMAGTWKPFGFSHNEGPKVSHLFFADDILLVAEASHTQVSEVKRVLDTFCNFSGQKVNFDKSAVFFSDNVKTDMMESLSNSLGVTATKNLGKYLGIPIGHVEF